MEEIWKDIPDYDGFYQASNLGNIRSLSRSVVAYFGIRVTKGKILSQSSSRGYKYVGLCKEGKPVSVKVHRAVLAAFIGNSSLHVNHINSDKADNRLSNLEYCTHQENKAHAFLMGRYRRNIVLDTQTGIRYNSVKEVAELFGIRRETLNAKLLGRRTNNTSFCILQK